MVARRVRYLAANGYLKMAYYTERKESGQVVKFYELSAKIRLAKWLDETDLESFIASVTEADAASILGALKKEGNAP